MKNIDPEEETQQCELQFIDFLPLSGNIILKSIKEHFVAELNYQV